MKVKVLKTFTYNHKRINAGDVTEIENNDLWLLRDRGIVKEHKIKRTTKELKTKRKTK